MAPGKCVDFATEWTLWREEDVDRGGDGKQQPAPPSQNDSQALPQDQDKEKSGVVSFYW
jgi:hypothetical protein